MLPPALAMQCHEMMLLTRLVYERQVSSVRSMFAPVTTHSVWLLPFSWMWSTASSRLFTSSRVKAFSPYSCFADGALFKPSSWVALSPPLICMPLFRRAPWRWNRDSAALKPADDIQVMVSQSLAIPRIFAVLRRRHPACFWILATMLHRGRGVCCRWRKLTKVLSEHWM